MGWLFTLGASRKDIINDVIAPWETKAASSKTIKHCTRGNVLWMVQETYVKATEQFERFIMCILLRRSGGDWGYKDMDESMHPHYYTCPLSYLEDTKVLCKDWRENVRKYNAHKNRKIEKGALYTLKNANVSWKQVRVVSLRPLRIQSPYGSIHKIAKRLLGDKIQSA